MGNTINKITTNLGALLIELKYQIQKEIFTFFIFNRLC